MKTEKKYSYGLDIGTTSIGWAVLDMAEKKIIGLGVRKFEEPRVPKTGATLTSKRREKRSLRRNLRRKSLRRERALKLMAKEGMINLAQLRASRINEPSSNNIFYTESKSLSPSPWELRARGLERKLDNIEWARVLFHLIKHRGYQSNAIEKKIEQGKSTDAGKLLSGVDGINKEFEEFSQKNPGIHTVGEMFYCNYKDKKRNSDMVYTKTIGREQINHELETLFKCQREFENPHTGTDFYQNILTILNNRRKFSKGPGSGPYSGDLIEKMLGKCTLDPSQKRAPRESYAGVMFRLQQSLNNITIIHANNEKTPLTEEQRKVAAEKALSVDKFTYTHLRKCIRLERGDKFKGLSYSPGTREISITIRNVDEDYYKKTINGNRQTLMKIESVLDSGLNQENNNQEIEDCLLTEFGMSDKIAKKLIALTNPETKVICDSTKLRKIIKILKQHNEDTHPDRLNGISRILSIHREEEASSELINFGISKECSEELATISLSTFLHLSVKAINRLLPHLKQGDTYDKACEKEGFNHAQAQINRDNITNPTVFRSFTQTKKVVKSMVEKYGVPKDIYLEVSRDLSRNKKEKEAMKKAMDQNERQRIIDEDHFMSEMDRLPVGRESQIWRFYKEQNGQCLYCGKSLGNLNEIFQAKGAPAAEIEHTLPYSRSLDNRQCNKTAACTTCNRNKGNRTPFEFFGSDESAQGWTDFKARCNTIYNYRKRNLLLTTQWDEEGTGERQLNDTRYISRLVQNWLEKECDYGLISTAEKGQKRSIFTVKGSATAVLRKIWKLERFKYRENGATGEKKERITEKNHALDAAVVVASTVRQVQILSAASRHKELYDTSIDNLSRPSKKIEAILPVPWENFSEELLSFCGYDARTKNFDSDPNGLLQKVPGAADKYDLDNYPISPVFISWMPQRGVKGAIHKDTIYKTREVEEEIEPGKTEVRKVFLKRINIKELSNSNIEKLAGRFDSVTGEETPFYRDLKQRLAQHNGDGKKAFEEPFRKGNKPNAPVIHKVRIRENVGGGMPILQGHAENGSMIRLDVFRRTGKRGKDEYLLVPIYTKQRMLLALPNKAIKAHAPEDEWYEVLENAFFCSLYKNDYVQIEKTDGLVEGYYVSTDRSSGRVSLHPHDSRDDSRISVKKNVLSFRKYHVDILGTRHPVHLPEKRLALSNPGERG